MARKKPKGSAAYVLYDVLYEDGSRSSNRKVPSAGLDGLDGEEPVRRFIEDQEQKIAEASGKARPKIESILRSGKKKPEAPGRQRG